MGKRNSDLEYRYENKKAKYIAPDVNNLVEIEDKNDTESDGDIFETNPDEFLLNREVVEGAILTDILLKNWRVGKPIGKGSFGEIFLASDDLDKPVNEENAKYVVKIEPHSNGPLFVEIHCLLNTGKPTDETPLPLGMPEYKASGSHYFKNSRYRFLILPRYKYDLHSIIKNHCIDPKSLLTIAVQILEVLQHLHDKGYAHSDIKAENLMIGTSAQVKMKKSVNNNNHINSSDIHDNIVKKIYTESIKPKEKSDTKVKKRGRPRKKIYPSNSIEFSGSNPVRLCRSTGVNEIYQDMVKSHYLRPMKKVNYCYGSDDESVYWPSKRQKIQTNEILTEDRIFLIDFGLASKFIDLSGAHRPFCMDQRRAHDGTLEFTSRDAHMGAHSRRSDLECLGYNLIYWSQGWLPWKNKTSQNQPEYVHRMKEYFMTDVNEIMKHFYGKDVPKYLGEFLNYVGKLSYDERPDYVYCKQIFIKELNKMRFDKSCLILDITNLKNNCKLIKDEDENIIAKMKQVKSIMEFGVLLPLKDSTPNNLSPKNLRSMTDKITKKNRKNFSLGFSCMDPDQIARDRAEREYEREQINNTALSTKYRGRPTYAIIELENKIKLKDKCDVNNLETKDENMQIKGYTKPMMDILRKRQFDLLEELDKKKLDFNQQEAAMNIETPYIRRKIGLRAQIIPTTKSLSYRNNLLKSRRRIIVDRGGSTDVSAASTDESSSCSTNSNDSSSTSSSNSNNSSSSISKSDTSSGVNACDEDSKESIDFSPIKTRRARQIQKKRFKNGKYINRRDDDMNKIRTFTRG